jgi:hypothetical protein
MMSAITPSCRYGPLELAIERAKASEDMALMARQKLRIAKLERQAGAPSWSARFTISARRMAAFLRACHDTR